MQSLGQYSCTCCTSIVVCTFCGNHIHRIRDWICTYRTTVVPYTLTKKERAPRKSSSSSCINPFALFSSRSPALHNPAPILPRVSNKNWRTHREQTALHKMYVLQRQCAQSPRNSCPRFRETNVTAKPGEEGHVRTCCSSCNVRTTRVRNKREVTEYKIFM
jgi:hypothetical protein